MQCKQCGNELGAKATFCPCGWQKHKEKSPYADAPSVPCSSVGCGIAAMCRIQTPDGLINVCWQHYDRYYFVQARDNCAAKGLHTTDQLRAAFKAGTATLARKLSNREFLVQREPGEDWDEQPST